MQNLSRFESAMLNKPMIIEEQQQIANTIKEQITGGVLMSLGARHFIPLGYADNYSGGLEFAATILPFRKDGTRATRPRSMIVTIELAYSDTYRIKVSYLNKINPVTHFEREGVYCDQLPKLLLALDYDGDEILNPRYAA